LDHFIADGDSIRRIMKPNKNILIRVTTVPLSLEKLINGQMRFMNEQGFEVYMISSWDESVSLIEEREFSQFLAVNMARTISPIKDIVSLIKLILVLNRLKPFIVHTHTPKAGLLGMLASWFTKVPVRLHTVAGLPLMEETGIKRKILNLAEQLTYRCAVKVYPNSTNLKEFIIQNKFCKPDKLKVIGNGSSNGIDIGFFKITPQILENARELRDNYNIPQDDFVYIFVGRLVKDKGIEELVDAFFNINAVYKNTWLVLVGASEPNLDPLSPNCLKQIEQNSNIVHVGYQNDVRQYFAMSNVLVFPSYREGFPNVPMQAGCLGLPAIVTDINGCNEIITDKENGLIISVKDTLSLKNAMEQILKDAKLYQHMKLKARPMIVERYEQTKLWALIFQEYQYHLKLHNLVS
jgi:glycosyltransferase involved in cell wall biosynthesis